ncbi:MAG: hypothetical protein HOV66_13575 [Streptomycetaceae bacterium]|nr:hypothetical protein [Streptomycetaceae bacterium]
MKTAHHPSPRVTEPPPCDCGGCREFRAIYAVARSELSLGERLAKRAEDRRQQRALEDAAAEAAAAADARLRAV